MKQGTLMLTMVAFATLLLASGIGTAVAEPQKNQIPVSATCDGGVQRTFVINGEGNVGHINESKEKNESTEKNIIIATSSFEFFAPEDTEMAELPIADQVIVDNGKKKGLEGDLITCRGVVLTELFRLGEVRVRFEFEGFVTPRGNR